MNRTLSRRKLLLGGFALATISPTTPASAKMRFYSEDDGTFDPELLPPDEGNFDPDLLPPAESETDFPITPVDQKIINERYRRRVVDFDDFEEPGTIVIDSTKRFLYFVFENYRAMRYGVGVGRAGFEWSGDAVIGMKRRWPRWVPPPEMVYRDENAAKWANGMPGGPDNPLGARALYLYEYGEDTLYRIHGTNQPSSIGKALSSGCIRMLNEDIAELYDRVAIGTPVVVRPADDRF
jgi:lipoprotein-anchoring transpeptidase ErfK/SrfK